MFEALAIAATGMQAQQQSIDTIAHNIANANTPTFKKGRVAFTDLVATSGVGAAGGRWTGAGVGVQPSGQSFELGELRRTDAPLDVAIEGDGFLVVSLPDGEVAFTRGGSLKVDRDGLLATTGGQPLRPAIPIPDAAESVAIGRDGRVTVHFADQRLPVEVGQLDLARVTSTRALVPQGDNLYRLAPGSDDYQLVRPGEDGAGWIAQGSIENSNVRMLDEVMNLMLAQRAYEANLKVVQSADEMLGMVNNLRR